jgi:hypothetical protein
MMEIKVQLAEQTKLLNQVIARGNSANDVRAESTSKNDDFLSPAYRVNETSGLLKPQYAHSSVDLVVLVVYFIIYISLIRDNYFYFRQARRNRQSRGHPKLRPLLTHSYSLPNLQASLHAKISGSNDRCSRVDEYSIIVFVYVT